jgi:hypothetical protein
MRAIRLWVDYEREPPWGFNAHAKTYAQAIDYLKTGRVAVISLDHDLGGARSGCDIAEWIEEQALFGEIPPIEWSVHSEDPAERHRIIQALSNASLHWRQHGGR